MSLSLPPKLRRFGIAATVMFASMLLIWWAIWSIAASQYRDFIDNWIATHSLAGYNVTYVGRETEGFPRGISMHFTDFILQNSDGVKIHAHDVSLSALPWRWHKFDAKLKHGFDLSIPFSGSKTLFITTDAIARNHTELAENGDWKFVDLDLTDAKALWGNDPFFSADTFAIQLERPMTPPKDRKEAGLTLAGSADAITLPPGLDDPFGSKIAKIDITLRVMGIVPDPRKKESVAEWNSSGSTIEFDKFFLQWGPLVLSTHGTLGLDDDLQPEGAFSARVGNDREVLNMLIAKNYIPKHEQSMLNSALDLFAKKSTVADTKGIEAPIAVQLGGLFLGPVRVYGFSEIEWGEAPPPLMDMPLDTRVPSAPALPVATPGPESAPAAMPGVTAPVPTAPTLPTR